MEGDAAASHKRLRSEAKHRSIRAKTGTLDDTIALSGYVLGPPGKGPIAFSILFNKVDGKASSARTAADQRDARAAAAGHGRRGCRACARGGRGAGAPDRTERRVGPRGEGGQWCATQARVPSVEALSDSRISSRSGG